MKLERKELAPGIYLTAIETTKFKSASMVVSLLTPLTEQTAAVNTLVPRVLRRGTEEYTTMRQISSQLEELYGASWEPAVTKRGDIQRVSFIGNFIDDAYTLDGKPVLTQVCHMLAQLLLHPATENNVFRADYVAGEKENLINIMRSRMNDKRQYATLRLLQEMCRGERYGIDLYGTEEQMAAITPEEAWNAYKALLAGSRVEIHYCGSAGFGRVEEALRELVDGLSARREGSVPDLKNQIVVHGKETVLRVQERLDVTQGKLTMGFRTGGLVKQSEEYFALLVFSALYGGTATSKLFMNVREKLSLCYYASCVAEINKGILIVSSGVEFDKMTRAEEEILAQLKAVQAGEFTADELESAKQSVISELVSVPDGREDLIRYYFSAAVTGIWRTPDEAVERVRAVTAEDVRKVAQAMELDTVYQLLGKEGK